MIIRKECIIYIYIWYTYMYIINLIINSEIYESSKLKESHANAYL